VKKSTRLASAVTTAVLAPALLAGCTGLEPVVGHGMQLAIYEPDGSTYDMWNSGELIDLGQGCVGVHRITDGETYLAAFASGTRVDDGGIHVPGSDRVLNIGDAITYRGGLAGSEAQIPSGCATPAGVWQLRDLSIAAQ